MILIINDTDGNQYGRLDNIDYADVYMPVTIEGLANEHGVQITTHGKPWVKTEPLEHYDLPLSPESTTVDNILHCTIRHFTPRDAK